MISLFVAGRTGEVIKALLTVVKAEGAKVGIVIGEIFDWALILVDTLEGRSEVVERIAGSAVGQTVAGGAVKRARVTDIGLVVIEE